MKKITALILVMLAVAMFLLPTDAAVVSEQAEYSLITPASEAYPDDGAKLTDGVFATLPDGASGYYSSGYYVGFNQANVDGDGNFVIILDLGSTQSDISAFTIGFLNETDIGIFAPKSVTFSVSDERNGTYTDVGTLNTAKSVSAGLSETYAETLTAEGVTARYVKVTVEHLGTFTDDSGAEKNAGWVFIDEISVLTGTSDASGSTESSLPTDDLSTPQTGDSGSLTVFALISLASFAMLVALVTIYRRRQF